MFFPLFTHHGGADGVTGSCHRLTWAPGASLLVDCGLFQGEDASWPSIKLSLRSTIYKASGEEHLMCR